MRLYNQTFSMGLQTAVFLQRAILPRHRLRFEPELLLLCHACPCSPSIPHTASLSVSVVYYTLSQHPADWMNQDEVFQTEPQAPRSLLAYLWVLCPSSTFCIWAAWNGISARCHQTQACGGREVKGDNAALSDLGSILPQFNLILSTT